MAFGMVMNIATRSAIMDAIKDFLGTDPKYFTVWQVAVRVVITYVCTILIIKAGHKRFMAQSTPFDAVVGFILGGVMSRAVNGQASFFPTLLGGFLLVMLHWATGWLALRWSAFYTFVKSESHLLMKDGEFFKGIMRKHLIDTDEIKMYMRQTANVDQFEDIKSATLERSGMIAIVKKPPKSEPKIIEVAVQEGVQTVRVVMEPK